MMGEQLSLLPTTRNGKHKTNGKNGNGKRPIGSIISEEIQEIASAVLPKGRIKLRRFSSKEYIDNALRFALKSLMKSISRSGRHKIAFHPSSGDRFLLVPDGTLLNIDGIQESCEIVVEDLIGDFHRSNKEVYHTKPFDICLEQFESGNYLSYKIVECSFDAGYHGRGLLFSITRANDLKKLCEDSQSLDRKLYDPVDLARFCSSSFRGIMRIYEMILSYAQVKYIYEISISPLETVFYCPFTRSVIVKSSLPKSFFESVEALRTSLEVGKNYKKMMNFLYMLESEIFKTPKREMFEVC